MSQDRRLGRVVDRGPGWRRNMLHGLFLVSLIGLAANFLLWYGHGQVDGSPANKPSTFDQQRSNTAAMPCPPPMHIVTSA